LIVNLREVANVPALWQVLKAIIKNQELPVGENPFLMGNDPLHAEPLPSHIKVVLFGPAWLMSLISYVDEEFTRLFKVRGEILTKVERTSTQIHAYRTWLQDFVKQEGVNSLGDDAICALIEHSQRLAGGQGFMSTDRETLATLVQEANTLIDQRLPEE